MKQFPGTKTEFDEWWEGRRDLRTNFPRSTRCPIARFIRHKGIEGASVGLENWCYITDEDIESYPLPTWAMKYVREFDESWKGNK